MMISHPSFKLFVLVFVFGSTKITTALFGCFSKGLLFTFQCTFCLCCFARTFFILLCFKSFVNTFSKTFLSFLFKYLSVKKVQNNKLVISVFSHKCKEFSY